MVGQKALQLKIKSLIESKKFPRFSILIGDKGSEKNEIVQFIKDELGCALLTFDTSIDSVRKMIDYAYEIHDTVILYLPDAYNMREVALNAMLKVAEEPPNNAYIILDTVYDGKLLPTITSRAMQLVMDRYTLQDIGECWGSTTKTFANMPVYAMCTTPGDVELLKSYDVDEFIRFVEKTVDHIGTAPGSNVFRIAEKLALGSDGKGYDVELFLRAFMLECASILTPMYVDFAIVTMDILRRIHDVRNINLAMILDMWILKIREVYFKYADD